MKVLAAYFLFVIPLSAAADPWQALQFLKGDWVAEDAGNAKGATSFTSEAQGKVLVRKSWAQYPDSRHDDVMMIYSVGGAIEALYADNEGHVIRYKVEASDDGNTIRFLNPQFRLTYRRIAADSVSGSFEIAQPEFKPYLTWKAVRKK